MASGLESVSLRRSDLDNLEVAEGCQPYPEAEGTGTLEHVRTAE